MADLDLLRFHAQSLRDYALFWFDAEARRENDVPEDEAAYHLCEHAAMLFRYTGQEVHVQGLTGLPAERRRSLVLAVCRYLANLTVTGKTRHLLAEEILDADQLTEVEDLIIERDAMEEVLSLSIRLSRDWVRDGDADLRRELATARSVVAEWDDALWERMDVVSVACRALAGLRLQLAVPPDERAQWWFGRAAALDDAFEQGSVLSLIGPARATRPEPPAPSEGVIPFSASLFARAEVPASLAAADTLSGTPRASLTALIPALAGVRVLVTRLNLDDYQFVFIEDHTGERSARLDGHRLAARLGGGELVASPIASGVAMLRTAVPFASCRLETPDGQPVGALVFDTTTGAETTP